MPSADVLISTSFSESHDQRLVFINDMEGGTVVSDKMLVGRQDDEQVTLTILPGNGYRYVPDSLRLMDVDRDNGTQTDITPYMTEITENSVSYTDSEGNLHSLPAATVVSAFGYKAYNPLEEAAKKYCNDVKVVGCAVKAGNALVAVREGYEAALAL